MVIRLSVALQRCGGEGEKSSAFWKLRALNDKGLFLGAFGESLWRWKLAILAAMAKSVSGYDSWRAIVVSSVAFIHPALRRILAIVEY
jgi:hypothetical protein